MNQVEALRSAGVDAHSLNSNTPLSEREFIHQDLASGHPPDASPLRHSGALLYRQFSETPPAGV